MSCGWRRCCSVGKLGEKSPQRPRGGDVPAPAGTKTAPRQGPQTAASGGGELFGREGLIGEITPVLQAAGRSQGGAVVLRGPAGIGKSSLLAVARRAATAAGMQV